MAPEVWTVEQGAQRVVGIPFGKPAESTEEEDAVLETTTTLQEKIASGRGIAYYENQDLGHPMIGHVVALTYGHPDAQFPGEPPDRLPDGLLPHITGGINWRYGLAAITTTLPDISDPQWDKPTTRIWVALDVAAEGPDGVTVVEGILNDADEVIGWHIVNPANEEDRLEFNEIADRLRLVFEEQGPMEELPLGESVVPPESPGYTSTLGEHLIEQHGYSPPYVAVKIRENNEKHLVDQHDVLHTDPSAENLPKDHNHDSLRPEDL